MQGTKPGRYECLPALKPSSILLKQQRILSTKEEEE